MKLFLRATLAAALLALPAAASNQPAPAQATPTPLAANSDNSPQVFLRRLHLVRPDLIPYPIEVDIFC